MEEYFTINNHFKKYLPIFIIMLSIIVLMGSSYALLRSSQMGENTYVMNVGLLEVTFVDSKTNALTLTNMIPISDEEGMAIEQELAFTVKNTGTIDAKYNVYIEETSTNPEFKSVLRFISNKNDAGYNNPETLSENKYIDKLGELSVGEEATYKVKVWLDESADSTYMDKEFKAKVIVESIQTTNKTLTAELKKIFATRTNSYVEDSIETIYISGNHDDNNSETTNDIDFNYVWYSGKLWRIIAIYPDGSMKLVTDDLMTSIAWGENSTYETSWIREWLNQEFLPTLYNYENIIVTDAGWYSIPNSSSTPVAPTGNYTLTEPVGLLNDYEYSKVYEKSTSVEDNYLNLGYLWWLNTPYNDTNVYYVDWLGNLANDVSTYSYAIRPSIVLKSNINFSDGNGTKAEPYKIIGDIESPTNNTTLLNTRVSGEYIKLESDERVFRIVDKEKIDETLSTKVVLNAYVEEPNEITGKNFSSASSDVLWTNVSQTSTSYTRGYLNTTWLNTLNTNLLEKGTYYLGYYDNGSYKNTVCSTVNSEVSIKQCIDNETIVSLVSNVDYVGLLRVGEMFAANFKEYGEYSDMMWLITPHPTKNTTNIIYDGSEVGSVLPVFDAFRDAPITSRPTINLKSSVVIKSGSGTKGDPFIIGLPS